MKKAASLLLLGVVALSAPAGALDALPDAPPIPADNPMSPAKIALGRQLYFDKRLSRNETISCNSCHDVTKGGDDTRPQSPGWEGRLGARNSPTVWNAAFHSVQFWDGRAASLEEQAKGPMINPVEMGMPSHDAVIERLHTIPGYVRQFAEVFGAAPDPLTIENVVRAIAAYERTLVTPGGPYDRFARGDGKALSAAAKRGLDLFKTAGCVSCHSGASFAGPSLPMGQGFYQKFPLIPGSEDEKQYGLTADLGRHEVTKSDADRNLWRVPTLRNVALTAPYFHTGSVPTLEEAVRVMARTQLGRTLAPEEAVDVAAFLGSLSGPRPPQSEPKLP